MATPTQAAPTITAQDTLTASLVARQSRTNDDSMSVPDQVAAMRDYCERNGWQVGAVYEERDLSGRTPLERRKGLRRAVADIENGRSQIVLTAYFDRFVRSVQVRAEVVERVESAGGRVMTMDVGQDSNATAAQWLSGTMQSAIAEFYARQVGEKLQTSKQRNIDRGVPPFPRITPAYQRRPDGTLEPHPTNGPLVQEAIRQRTAKSPASFVAIARWLNANGLVTESGKPITSSGVETMLGSRLLIGEIHFGTFRPNRQAGDHWGGTITDRATFRRMQSLRALRGRNGKSEQLLARQGILDCATCGGRLVASTSRPGANGARYSYYRCGNRDGCDRPASIAVDVADAAVVAETIRLSADAVGRDDQSADVDAAKAARDLADRKLAETIQTLALAGVESEPASADVIAALAAERDAAADRHQRLIAFTDPALVVTTADDWDAFTLDERREIIGLVVVGAVVQPGRGPNRITVIARTA